MNTLLRTTFLAFLSLWHGPALALTIAELTGTWYGVFVLPDDQSVRTVLEVYPRPNGEMGAELIAVELGGGAWAANDISLDENRLRLVMSKVSGAYLGEVALEEGRILGEIRFSGTSFPLDLVRVDQVPGLPRPQTPRPPYPYVEEEVTYPHAEAGLILAGTLTRPQGEGPFPAVLLATGSGQQDRDETIYYHRPFRLLADYLTRRGLVVLRADDRGWGASTGDATLATTADFAADARAGIAYLRGRPDIDPARVGLVGHSEGGMIATLVAASDPDLAFIVLLAGPGVTGEQILHRQRTDIGRSEGANEAQLAAALGWFDEIHAALRTEADLPGAANTIRQRFAAMDAERKGLIGWDDQVLETVLSSILNPWYRYFLDFDPAPLLAHVSCPVLALNGAKDIQVASDENLQAIAAALQAGGNPDFEVVELPDLNHLFQTAETGALTEYVEIAETMAPIALRTTSDWIRQRVGLPPLDTAVRQRRDQVMPATLTLLQNYPNPFNTETVIRFAGPVDGPVTLRIFNHAGQRVVTLVSDFRSAGANALYWDGRDDEGTPLASGVYFYQLQSDTQTQTRSLLLLR